jgi:ribonuclease P protein component
LRKAHVFLDQVSRILSPDSPSGELLGASIKAIPSSRWARLFRFVLETVLTPGAISMKFGPDRRVRKSEEFQAIQRKGRRISTAHFVLILCRSEPGLPARLGITASRRVGNSVRRSRLKRIVREAFRCLDGWVPPGIDLVVICRKDDPALGTQTVVQEWRSSHKRLQKALAELGVSGNTDPRPKPGAY